MIDSRMGTSFEDFLEIQKRFNDAVYGDIVDDRKEEITKSLALALHSEVASIASAVNFKDHTSHRAQVNKDKLLYESVDAFRYILALLNTWDITADQFCRAFSDKNSFLWTRKECEKTRWNGQDVILIDVDDVLAGFREGFFAWIESRYGVYVDIETDQYYTTTPLKSKNLNPEEIFQEFLREGGMSTLPVIRGTQEFLETLMKKGYWIQLLTARPESNPRCFYDTFLWLRDAELPFHRVNFAPEKFIWAAQSQYYGKCRIVAVDDSPKHCAEYAKHGIEVASPVKSYNREVHGIPGVHMYETFDQAIEIIDRLISCKEDANS